MKYIAVEGCQLQLQSGTGNISVTGTTSSKVKYGGKAAYKELKFSISGYLGGAITNSDGQGSGSINATAQKVKIEGNSAILEGDTSSTITISGTTTTQSGTVKVTATDTVKVTSAGQQKVQGA